MAFRPVAGSSRVDRTSAPVPVSALIDSGQYVGSNPEVTATPGDGLAVVGLAEYSNANFFSKDTTALKDAGILRSFPHPAPEDLVLGPPTPVGDSGPLRRYFAKMGAGDRIDYLAVPSALYEFLPDALKDRQVGLDAKVLEHYAEKLLPRAVGYSAALLDYFFRGAFGAEVSETGITIFNGSAGEAAQGEFQVIREHPDGRRDQLARWANVLLAPEGSSSLLPIARLPGATPAETRCWLIFRGRLGDEPDAVAGSPVACPFELRLRPRLPGPSGTCTTVSTSQPRSSTYTRPRALLWPPTGFTPCTSSFSGPGPRSTARIWSRWNRRGSRSTRSRHIRSDPARCDARGLACAWRERDGRASRVTLARRWSPEAGTERLLGRGGGAGGG